MKKYITILGILSVFFAYSQDFKTIYYDANWKPITSKENAEYYREIKVNAIKKDHFDVSDHYMSGDIQMTAVLSSLKPEVMDGITTYYYPGGKKKTELVFEKGKENGTYIEWYESGSVKEEGQNVNGKMADIWKYYYFNGKLRMEGKYEKSEKIGDWKIYTIEGKYYLKYSYLNGLISKVELIDKSLGYYEYFTELKDNNVTINPFIGFKTEAEYKVTEDLIRKNISILQKNVDLQSFDVLYGFSMIWITNCPYLGKFAVKATKFMQAYTLELEKTYKYSSLMSRMYILGLGSYFLDHKGIIEDINDFQAFSATFMLDYYLELKKRDKLESSKKLEDLVKLKENKKLYDFIKYYK